MTLKELNQRSPQHSMDVGSDLSYRHDNRWTNILPFDHSRVKLAVISGDESCCQDYINANYISGLDSSRDYIATQGPLTRTVSDFWRMVWEQNVSVIVMLADFEELDKRTQIIREKVARYFPGDEETGPSQYGLIQVSRTRKDYNHKWEIRTLKLTHTRARKVRILKHFFFKNWSDHEADIDKQELVDFVELLRAEMKSLPKAPMVVHCSAGVGRTGTFIAVDYFYKLLSSMRPRSQTPGLGEAANKTVDIFGRVLKLRDCRRFMVQSLSQYVFVYDAVLEILRRLFQLQQSKGLDICDQEGHQSLDILSCQGSLEDTVYDDVAVLK
ncbi:unnamed protein product [Candidula unifasciata]|uniref:Uncharacterized protein n=1 Tax=Candidula unifasciata TaxID=100452 RepID=A0A8S3Z490_9EUPU|nr:unnamed protein product [Candidula unifasciata]